jgi:hypothetical protein
VGRHVLDAVQDFHALGATVEAIETDLATLAELLG